MDLDGKLNLAERNIDDLQGLIDFLKKNEKLTTVHSEVDINYEMSGIAKEFEGKNPVLFEKLKNYDTSIFTGLYWSREVLAAIFDVPAESLPFLTAKAIDHWVEKPMDPIVVDQGPANEVIKTEEDDLLRDIPIPIHSLKEGGPYLDSSILIAKDPDINIRNASIQRLMVAGPNRLTMQLDDGRHLRDYYERAEKSGKPLEITINNGVGLPVHFASTTPTTAAPIDKDELGVASALLGEPLKLIRSQTVDVEGIADAQYVIEGEILPYVREPEGPFAEVTGYYASQDDRWVIKVKAVTHRRNPVFHTILPGKEVYNAVGLMAESSILNKMKETVPDVKDVYLSHGGCGFYHANVKVKKSKEGVQYDAIEAAFSAFPSLRRVTVVDHDVDIYSAEDMEWALATRHDPVKDKIIFPDSMSHELNPITRNGLDNKIGIDATAPYPQKWEFQRMDMKKVNLADYQISK